MASKKQRVLARVLIDLDVEIDVARDDVLGRVIDATLKEVRDRFDETTLDAVVVEVVSANLKLKPEGPF